MVSHLVLAAIISSASVDIMDREDKFVGLLDFGNGSVAEFEYAQPMIVKNYGSGYSTETHFRIDCKNLLTRIENLKLPKNYGKVPWSMVQENAALAAMGC